MYPQYRTPGIGGETIEKPSGFFDKRLAGCYAHQANSSLHAVCFKKKTPS